MNPNSHIPYLQAQLAFAWHNRLVLDRRLSAIDVTIGGVFDYVGLKDFKICPFLSLYHDEGA